MTKLQFIIDGKHFETADVYKTGSDLKTLAGLPLDTNLYLSLKRPYEDELIGNDQPLDLSRPEIEYFYTAKVFKFFINGKPFEWYKQFISAEELRKLGTIDPEHEVYTESGPYATFPLSNKDRINLVEPSRDRFVSKKRESELNIIVNGRIKPWRNDIISFDQVVILAFGMVDQSLTRAYTATYSRGTEPKPEGIIVKGNEIRVKDKMIFNVTATDKS